MFISPNCMNKMSVSPFPSQLIWIGGSGDWGERGNEKGSFDISFRLCMGQFFIPWLSKKQFFILLMLQLHLIFCVLSHN